MRSRYFYLTPALIVYSSFVFEFTLIARGAAEPAEAVRDSAAAKLEAKTSKPSLQADSDRDARTLAARIDAIVAAKAAAQKAPLAALADDAEFHRRIWLDLAGKIPSVADTRAFLADQSPDKRRKLIDKLLASPYYVNHYTRYWKQLLVPETKGSFEIQYSLPNFETWLREKIRANASYDSIVKEIVAHRLPNGAQGSANFFFNQDAKPDPGAFYVAKQGKPENLGAGVARLFLGVRIECAQCHNHPFARWKRDEFWSFAAFFGGVQRMGDDDQPFGMYREVVGRLEQSIPGSDRFVQPAFLGGGEPELSFNKSARDALADWLVAKDNPYFAKAAVNRIWGWMFGIGIVDPIDDLSDQNPPSHPELLEALARGFADHDFDLKFLIRAIALSDTYQRSSVNVSPSADKEEVRLFTYRALKGLTGDQLYDSILQAIGERSESSRDNPFLFNPGDRRSEFLEKFAKTEEKATEHETSILQALALMNGGLVEQATRHELRGTLSAVVESPFLDIDGKVETLFLATLCRKPTPAELERMVDYVERGGPTGHPKKALADVFWALLNDGEFLLNH